MVPRETGGTFSGHGNQIRYKSIPQVHIRYRAKKYLAETKFRVADCITLWWIALRGLLWVHHLALARPPSAIFWSRARDLGSKFSRPRFEGPGQWRFEFRDGALHFVSIDDDTDDPHRPTPTLPRYR